MIKCVFVLKIKFESHFAAKRSRLSLSVTPKTHKVSETELRNLLRAQPLGFFHTED